MSNGQFNLGPLTPEELGAYEVHVGDDLAPPTGSEVTMQIKAGGVSPEAFMLIATGSTPEEWAKVGLHKWEHYRNVVLPSGNPIAMAVHEHGLLKLIPFLIGRPDLEITPEDEERIHGEQNRNRQVGISKQHIWHGPHMESPRHELTTEEVDALQSVLKGESIEGWHARQTQYPAGSPERQIQDLDARNNDDPHRHEEDARPYPKAGLDFGPPLELQPGEVPLEPDCG